MQRTLYIATRLHQLGNTAELGAHPCRVDQRSGLSTDQDSAGQQDIAAVQQVRRIGWLGIPRHWIGFACQRGRIDAHIESFQDPAIGRHIVAS